MKAKDRSRLAWTFFAVSLVWFAIVALDNRDNPFFELPISDAQSYDEWAQRIAANGLSAEPVFHQPPLYPSLLGKLYGATDATGRLAAAVALHGVLWALSCALLVLIAAELSRRRSVAICAGILALLYAPLLFHSLKLIPTASALATQSLALWALLIAARKRRRLNDLLAGIAIGLACTARAEMLLFLAASTLWILWSERQERRSAFARAALLLAGAALLITPVTLHNRAKGATVLIASAGGENLFIGNQRGGDGGHQPLDPRAGDLFSQRAVAIDIATAASETPERELNAAEVSRYWSRRAWSEIRASPVDWLRLELRKLGRLFTPGDPTDMYSLSLERSHYLPSLWLAPIGSAAIWLLCLFGLQSFFRDRRERAPLRPIGPWLAMLLAQLVTLLLFFVSTRLRLPFIFWSLPLAALGLGEIVDSLRSAAQARRRMAIAMLLPALLLSGAELLWVQPSAREAMRLAAVLSRQQRLDESLAILTPLADSPGAAPRLLDQTGWVHAKKEEYATAITYYRAALADGADSGAEPLNVGQTLVRLALAQEAMGELSAAWATLERARREQPQEAGVYFERGMFQMRRGDRGAAVAEMQRAAALAPKWSAPQQMLQRLR